MVQALVLGGADVHIITDMHNREDTLFMLRSNGFVPPILESNIHNSDFEQFGEACKAVLLRQLNIDVFLDDFPAYLAEGCPVRLLVQPDLTRPYYHDTWVTNGGEGDFGRRKRVETYLGTGTVLETFNGVVDNLDAETAYVTLTSTSNGDKLWGEYPAAAFRKLGIEEDSRFILRTVEDDGATRIQIEAVPDVELTDRDAEEIRSRIDKILPGDQDWKI